MPNLESVLLRGTRAAQPAATAVGTGALYFVTDEGVTEQSTGAAWVTYSGVSGSLGINQLTGDVTAGPGTGSQAATVAARAITFAKTVAIATSRILGRVTAASGDIEELTGTQATTLLDNVVGDSGAGGTKGLVPAPAAGDAAAGKFLKADATWAVPGGGGGITQLTGDVTAGPGSGSQVATIANDAVTNAKLANVNTATIKGRVTAASGDPEDLTGTQATTLLDVFTSALKGLAPSSGGGTTNYLRADGSWNAPPGSGVSVWDFEVTAASDQDVTNSSTLTNDNELTRASILANEVWYFELLIIYSATDASRDFKWSLAASAGTMTGWHQHTGLSSADSFVNSGLSCLGAASFSAIVWGTEAAQAIRASYVKAMVRFSSNCTFNFQFAEDGIGAGTVARREAGSVLRGKKLL